MKRFRVKKYNKTMNVNKMMIKIWINNNNRIKMKMKNSKQMRNQRKSPLI